MAAFLLLLLGSALLAMLPLAQQARMQRRAARRLALACGGRAAAAPPAPAWRPGLLAALGRPLLGGGAVADSLRAELQSLGWAARDAAAAFTGARLLGALLATALAASVSAAPLRDALLAAALAYLLPGLLVSRLARGRVARMRAELPLALDGLVLVLEGGAGVEQALRFAAGLRVHPAPRVQAAFRLLAQDLQLGTPYELALQRLGERLGCEEGRLLVEVLRQSLVHGTELLEPLKALSRDLRQRRLADARAQVGKSATLMTLVMVTTLLPALLALVGAPALSNILLVLGSIG